MIVELAALGQFGFAARVGPVPFGGGAVVTVDVGRSKLSKKWLVVAVLSPWTVRTPSLLYP
jgi:hypothetical protein